VGVHAYAFPRQTFGNLAVAIQAERDKEVGVMHFPDHVMIFKKAVETMLRYSLRFYPPPSFSRNRLKAGIPAE